MNMTNNKPGSLSPIKIIASVFIGIVLAYLAIMVISLVGMRYIMSANTFGNPPAGATAVVATVTVPSDMSMPPAPPTVAAPAAAVVPGTITRTILRTVERGGMLMVLIEHKNNSTVEAGVGWAQSCKVYDADGIAQTQTLFPSKYASDGARDLPMGGLMLPPGKSFKTWFALQLDPNSVKRIVCDGDGGSYEFVVAAPAPSATAGPTATATPRALWSVISGTIVTTASDERMLTLLVGVNNMTGAPLDGVGSVFESCKLQDKSGASMDASMVPASFAVKAHKVKLDAKAGVVPDGQGVGVPPGVLITYWKTISLDGSSSPVSVECETVDGQQLTYKLP